MDITDIKGSGLGVRITMEHLLGTKQVACGSEMDFINKIHQELKT